MPRAVWGISKSDIDGFDRSRQFTPYIGQLPPIRVVYKWRITRMNYAAATGGKNAQLRIGVELVPRNTDERKYRGYFVMLYRSLTDTNQFTYVPLLDTLGITSTAFINKTVVDSEGKILRIGKWKNDGTQEIMGQLIERESMNGNMQRDLGWIGSVPDDDEFDDDNNDDDNNDDDNNDDDDDDELGF